ncbi:MAG: hypothetical protein JJU11_08030 [Candidatus Sumerlaeia bacterium]|nr:hypothetical protein [Candidatus Sumerlaeia bacterium]
MKVFRINARTRFIRAMTGVLAMAAMVVVATGCGGRYVEAPVVPPPGVLFAQVKAPLQHQFSNEGQGTMVGNRTGESVAHYLHIPFFSLPLEFGWGDASIKTSAQNGGLDTVHLADYEFFNILGIYSRTTIIVSGD